MAFCRNCGNELSGDSKFCNKCGTSTDVAAAPISSGSRNLGAEVSVHYYSSKMRNYKIRTTCFINIFWLIGLLVLSALPFLGFLKVLGWLFLIVDTIWQVICISFMDKHILRICEHGIRGAQANGPVVSEFSFTYDEINRIKVINTNSWTCIEQIQIFTNQGTVGCFICEPNSAAAEIEKLSGRTLR